MLYDLIGKGPRFPLSPNKLNGVNTNDNLDRINQSLMILLSTNKGTRLMNPGWGSDIDRYKFDPLDSVLLDKLDYSIRDCIKTFEPRINVTDIDFNIDNINIDNHILYISIYYTLINSDIEGNFVYPFRLGTQDTYTTDNY